MLTIEAGFEHVYDDVRNVYELSSPASESKLMRILESRVTSARSEANGDLCILSNGDTLCVYKEPNFESYRLKIAGEELIV